MCALRMPKGNVWCPCSPAYYFRQGLSHWTWSSLDWTMSFKDPAGSFFLFLIFISFFLVSYWGGTQDLVLVLLAHFHWATHPGLTDSFQHVFWRFELRSSCHIFSAVWLFQLPTLSRIPMQKTRVINRIDYLSLLASVLFLGPLCYRAHTIRFTLSLSDYKLKAQTLIWDFHHNEFNALMVKWISQNKMQMCLHDNKKSFFLILDKEYSSAVRAKYRAKGWEWSSGDLSLPKVRVTVGQKRKFEPSYWDFHILLMQKHITNKYF